MNRPRIAVSGRSPGALAPYRAALERCGCEVLEAHSSELPADDPAAAHARADALLAACDGVLLPGGGDIDPARYRPGDPLSPRLGGIDPARDALEWRLAQESLHRGLPVLAVCRGLQVVTCALGGTLFQDIDEELPDRTPLIRHQQTRAWNPSTGAWEPDAGHSRAEATHEITLAEGSLLAQVLGATRVSVNSMHHQAPKNFPASLTATAWAADGVVEGVESPVYPHLLGVQFHPEEMVEAFPQFRALFDWLANAARGAGARRARI